MMPMPIGEPNQDTLVVSQAYQAVKLRVSLVAIGRLYPCSGGLENESSFSGAGQTPSGLPFKRKQGDDVSSPAKPTPRPYRSALVGHCGADPGDGFDPPLAWHCAWPTRAQALSAAVLPECTGLCRPACRTLPSTAAHGSAAYSLDTHRVYGADHRDVVCDCS